MFDCQMTIKGDGHGRNGRFKTDQTAPVSRFMVDNIYLYPKVKQHVLGCSKCDPTEALRFYLNRRLTLDKFQPKAGKVWPVAGQLTGSLAKLALSYERMSAKARPVPASLVNEFIWRTADSKFIHEHEGRLSIRELVAGAEMVLKMTMPWRATSALSPSAGRLSQVFALLQHQSPPETEEEMEALIQIMEVQVT